MQQSEPANLGTSGDVIPPEPPGSAPELAVVPRPHYRWYDKLAAVMAAIFCFEVGLFLLVYPWVTEWEPGPGFFPVWFRHLWDTPAFRGALSGLGALNIWISFVEVFPIPPFLQLTMPILWLLAALMFQQHMEHKFDPVESARSFDDPARDAWQKPAEVIAALNLKPGQSVADIGAGTGYFTIRLAKSPAAPKVYASDLEPGMVDYLRKRAAQEKLTNVVAVQSSAASPNLPEPVDVILIVNTWHHIADRGTYFKSLAKFLEPGGRLAIIDYVKGAPMGPPEHFRFTPAQIRAELKKAGYTPVAEHKFLPNQQFQVFTLAQ